MKELIITILQILAPISVALIVFAQGLKISPSQVMIYFKERPWTMLRSLVAVLVLVPAAALAVESGVRHPVLAITIAASNFSPQKTLPVLVPYMVVFIVVTTVYLLWRKRRLAERSTQPTRPGDA